MKKWREVSLVSDCKIFAVSPFSCFRFGLSLLLCPAILHAAQESVSSASMAETGSRKLCVANSAKHCLRQSGIEQGGSRG